MTLVTKDRETLADALNRWFNGVPNLTPQDYLLDSGAVMTLPDALRQLAEDREFLNQACLEPGVPRLWADIIETAQQRLKEQVT